MHETIVPAQKSIRSRNLFAGNAARPGPARFFCPGRAASLLTRSGDSPDRITGCWWEAYWTMAVSPGRPTRWARPCRWPSAPADRARSFPPARADPYAHALLRGQGLSFQGQVQFPILNEQMFRILILERRNKFNLRAFFVASILLW